MGGAPSDSVGRKFDPELAPAPPSTVREDGAEVMRVPVGAAIQSSSSLLPSVRRICADWKAERRAAERASAAEGWAQRDELSELSEQLTAILEAYGDEEEEEEEHVADDE